jgi:hypothetical protein
LAVFNAWKTSKGKTNYIDLIGMIHNNVWEFEAAYRDEEGMEVDEQIPLLFSSDEQRQALFLSV